MIMAPILDTQFSNKLIIAFHDELNSLVNFFDDSDRYNFIVYVSWFATILHVVISKKRKNLVLTFAFCHFILSLMKM